MRFCLHLEIDSNMISTFKRPKHPGFYEVQLMDRPHMSTWQWAMDKPHMVLEHPRGCTHYIHTIQRHISDHPKRVQGKLLLIKRCDDSAQKRPIGQVAQNLQVKKKKSYKILEEELMRKLAVENSNHYHQFENWVLDWELKIVSCYKSKK